MSGMEEFRGLSLWGDIPCFHGAKGVHSGFFQCGFEGFPRGMDSSQLD